MLWFFLCSGILLFVSFMFKFKSRFFRYKSHAKKDFSSFSISTYMPCIKKDKTNISLPRKSLSRFTKTIKYLSSLSKENLLPASRALLSEAYFLQAEAHYLFQKQFPLFPHNNVDNAIINFAKYFLFDSQDPFTQATLSAALEVEQKKKNFRESGLESLPFTMQSVLLNRLFHYASLCEDGQRSKAAAEAVLRLCKCGKMRRAIKLAKRFSNRLLFLQEICHSDKSGKYLVELRLKLPSGWPVVKAQEIQQQNEFAQELLLAIQSLYELRRIEWVDILEELSISHKILKQDPIYSKMDRESRHQYRRQASKIAKRLRLSEQAVCLASTALCKQHTPSSIKSHVGYYLIDEGYTDLLQRVRSYSFSRKLIHFLHKHSFLCFQIASFLLFSLLFIWAYRFHIPALLFPPFILLLGMTLQNSFFRYIPYKTAPLPRMDLHQLPSHERILIVCPAILRNPEQAISAVKHLAVLYEANRDQNLHFLLIGDFPPALTATLSTDAETVAAASQTIQELNTESGHAFFYLQRARTYSAIEKCYQGLNKEDGALNTVLRLICDRDIQDLFVCSNIDPALLKSRYRYVLAIKNETILPPGSVLRLTGTIMHPLQKRQRLNGRMRGVTLIQPCVYCAAHTFSTRLSRIFCNNPIFCFDQKKDRISYKSAFSGVGIIDPEPFLNETMNCFSLNFGPYLALTPGDHTGIVTDNTQFIFRSASSTLKEWSLQLFNSIQASWKNLICHIRFKLFANQTKETFSILLSSLRSAMITLLAPFQFFLIFYAIGTDRLILGAIVLLSFFSPLRQSSAIKLFFCQLSLLPLEFMISIRAIGSSLGYISLNSQAARSINLFHSPSCINADLSKHISALNLSCAGLVAASVFLLNSSYFFLILAVLWAVFPFVLSSLESTPAFSKLSPYMYDDLYQLAKKTFLFFETVITEKDHALPMETLQIVPNAGFSHKTTPSSIAFYLCALIVAHKLGFISLQEMLKRTTACITSIESLPKWNGLFYERYDTCTLTPDSFAKIRSNECGILLICLFTCEQHLKRLSEKAYTSYILQERIKQLYTHMQLTQLYDAKTGLFYTHIDPSHSTLPYSYHELLADECRMLSFSAIMLGQVPPEHWYRMRRNTTRKGILTSKNGSVSEYMLPVLFLPLIPGTLLHHSCLHYFHAQKNQTIKKVYGVGKSLCFATTDGTCYQNESFGLAEYALMKNIRTNVVSPYASLLCLPFSSKKVFNNLQRLRLFGLDGPLGLYEAVDFSTQKSSKSKLVRCYTSTHQGMILCALCNVLTDGYIAELMLSSPKVEAFRTLLEE